MESQGKIKTALELALEKTRGMEVSSQDLRAIELKKIAQLAIGEYLNGKVDDPLTSLKSKSANEKELLELSRVASVIFAKNIQLPGSSQGIEFAQINITGLSLLLKANAQVKAIETNLQQILKQYSKQRDDISERLKEQFLESSGYLEQQLSARAGRQIKIDPNTNPEFAKQRLEVMKKVDMQYMQVINGLKDQLLALLC